MSAKFDEDVNNSLVAIVFTRIRHDTQTDCLTDWRMEPWQHYYIPSAMRCVGINRESKSKQANSDYCGPPLGNNFDLEEGQRSRSMSRDGVTWKGLSQGSCMLNINTLSLILQKIWARLKFLWQTDGRRDGQTDEWDLMSPRFRESGGQLWFTCCCIMVFMLGIATFQLYQWDIVVKTPNSDLLTTTHAMGS